MWLELTEVYVNSVQSKIGSDINTYFTIKVVSKHAASHNCMSTKDCIDIFANLR